MKVLHQAYFYFTTCKKKFFGFFVFVNKESISNSFKTRFRQIKKKSFLIFWLTTD